MSGWGCPHEFNGTCQHVKDRACDPGMKGCVLAGRYFFTGHQAEDKNARFREKLARAEAERKKNALK